MAIQWRDDAYYFALIEERRAAKRAAKARDLIAEVEGDIPWPSASVTTEQSS
jgi:hypothetical protein